MIGEIVISSEQDEREITLQYALITGKIRMRFLPSVEMTYIN